MPKNAVETRDRLREAALKLFLDRGYDATTTAQIGELAHVTERTYFRHFKNKRDVLFEGDAELHEVMTNAIDEAQPDARPLQLVMLAYFAAVPLLIAGRPIARRRAAVIAATPSLLEGVYAKAAARNDALSDAFLARGMSSETARLASRIGAAIFDQAMHAWNADPTADLTDLIARSADTAQRVLCEAPRRCKPLSEAEASTSWRARSQRLS